VVIDQSVKTILLFPQWINYKVKSQYLLKTELMIPKSIKENTKSSLHFSIKTLFRWNVFEIMTNNN